MSNFVVAGITQVETIVNVEKLPVAYEPLTCVPNSIHISAGGDAYNEALALAWLGDNAQLQSGVRSLPGGCALRAVSRRVDA